jgi:hypothetical protein
VLILALMAVQAAGLTIHALDRVELQRAAASREAAVRSFSLWRGLVLAAPERRASLLADAELPASVSATLDDAPAARPGMPPVPERLARLFRLDAPPPGRPKAPPRAHGAAASARPRSWPRGCRRPGCCCPCASRKGAG